MPVATETGVSRTYSLIDYVTTCIQLQETVRKRVKCLSSSLFGDFFIYERVPKWLKGTGCNPVIRWFESGCVLQYGESSLTVKRAVVVRVLTVRFCPFTPDNLKFL